MKKWIFSATVSLLLANPTLATNVTTSLKTEQGAAIEGSQSGLFLTLRQFKSDEDSSIRTDLELKSGSVECDEETNKKRRTAHTVNLTQGETEKLIVAINHLVATEIEPSYQGVHSNLPPKLLIEKDTTQPEKRQYTMYNGDIKTDGTQAWLSK
ncbi:hypothetical protein [Cycloclasticus pugetii]|uniref:hypothetical protein n=1 Tax=Cycloclasticus pugetii TaxID=34068 RepID=UPI003A9131C4